LPSQSVTRWVPTQLLWPATQISPHLREYSTLDAYVTTGTRRQTVVISLRFAWPNSETLATRHADGIRQALE
jgi:hypothetical protein